MKIFRLGLWVSIFVLGAFLAYSTISWTLKGGQSDGSSSVVAIGGPFNAVLHDGSPVTHDAIKGRPHVMFFGFTHCPDVCPTTLYEASQWLEALGADGDKLDIYFVSVDPERDTPEVLNNYLSAFDKRIKGITGTKQQIAKLVKQWRVYSEKVALEDDDYTMNHTATTFLMKANGEFFGTVAYGEDTETAKTKLSRLVATGS